MEDCHVPVLSKRAAKKLRAANAALQAEVARAGGASVAVGAKRPSTPSSPTPLVGAKPVGVAEARNISAISSGVSETTKVVSSIAEAKKSNASKGAKGRRPSAVSFRSNASKSTRGSTRSRGKSKKRGSAEAIVQMTAPGSDYAGTGPSALGLSLLDRYVAMMVNPWGGEMQRLPDTCIVPTGLGKVLANRTYTISGTTSSKWVLFGLHSRMSNYSPTSPRQLGFQNEYQVTGGVVKPYVEYEYVPGDILNPQLVDNPASIPTAMQALGIGPWSDDFGTEQSQLASFTAAYRTLAMAIRIRVIGLPSSIFMTPGKIYVAQVRCDQSDLPFSEQDFVVLERLGRASHVALDAVREAGSKTWFATPDGVDKFTLSSQFFLPGGSVDPYLFDGTATPGQNIQLFPAASSMNFYPLIPKLGIVPYSSSQTIGSPQNVTNADGTMMLFVGVFGATAGVTLEVDYAKVYEYLPQSNSPAGIDTAVQLPSSSGMDTIFASCAVLAQTKPVMFQAPGDTTIFNSRSGPNTHASPEALSRGLGVRAKLRDTIARSVGKTISAKAEGWWDWLETGQVGGFKWDLRDKDPSKAKKYRDW